MIHVGLPPFCGLGLENGHVFSLSSIVRLLHPERKCGEKGLSRVPASTVRFDPLSQKSRQTQALAKASDLNSAKVSERTKRAPVNMPGKPDTDPMQGSSRGLNLPPPNILASRPF